MLYLISYIDGKIEILSSFSDAMKITDLLVETAKGFVTDEIGKKNVCGVVDLGVCKCAGKCKAGCVKSAKVAIREQMAENNSFTRLLSWDSSTRYIRAIELHSANYEEIPGRLWGIAGVKIVPVYRGFFAVLASCAESAQEAPKARKTPVAMPNQSAINMAAVLRELAERNRQLEEKCPERRAPGISLQEVINNDLD